MLSHNVLKWSKILKESFAIKLPAKLLSARAFHKIHHSAGTQLTIFKNWKQKYYQQKYLSSAFFIWPGLAVSQVERLMWIMNIFSTNGNMKLQIVFTTAGAAVHTHRVHWAIDCVTTSQGFHKIKQLAWSKKLKNKL